jgi:hypothetical protein
VFQINRGNVIRERIFTGGFEATKRAREALIVNMIGNVVLSQIGTIGKYQVAFGTYELLSLQVSQVHVVFQTDLVAGRKLAFRALQLVFLFHFTITLVGLHCLPSNVGFA